MDDDTFATVMNRINVVIVNPVFLAVFLGAPAPRSPAGLGPAPLGDRGGRARGRDPARHLVFNIPLNNALADGRLAGGVRDPLGRSGTSSAP